MPSLSQSICLGRELPKLADYRRLSLSYLIRLLPHLQEVSAFPSLPIDDVVSPQNRSPRTHEQRAWCVLCARACLPASRGLALPFRELVPAESPNRALSANFIEMTDRETILPEMTGIRGKLNVHVQNLEN